MMADYWLIIGVLSVDYRLIFYIEGSGISSLGRPIMAS